MADPSLRPIIVHAPEDAEAACRAASELGVPVMLVSGAGGGLYAGAGWFRKVVHRAVAAHPGVHVTAVLDCADQAGVAAEAFGAGIGGVLFSGPTEVAEKLRAIAVATGATLYTEIPAGLDLRGHRDPDEACRRWLGGDFSR